MVARIFKSKFTFSETCRRSRMSHKLKRRNDYYRHRQLVLVIHFKRNVFCKTLNMNSHGNIRSSVIHVRKSLFSLRYVKRLQHLPSGHQIVKYGIVVCVGPCQDGVKKGISSELSSRHFTDVCNVVTIMKNISKPVPAPVKNMTDGHCHLVNSSVLDASSGPNRHEVSTLCNDNILQHRVVNEVKEKFPYLCYHCREEADSTTAPLELFTPLEEASFTFSVSSDNKMKKTANKIMCPIAMNTIITSSAYTFCGNKSYSQWEETSDFLMRQSFMQLHRKISPSSPTSIFCTGSHSYTCLFSKKCHNLNDITVQNSLCLKRQHTRSLQNINISFHVPNHTDLQPSFMIRKQDGYSGYQSPLLFKTDLRRQDTLQNDFQEALPVTCQGISSSNRELGGQKILSSIYCLDNDKERKLCRASFAHSKLERDKTQSDAGQCPKIYTITDKKKGLEDYSNADCDGKVNKNTAVSRTHCTYSISHNSRAQCTYSTSDKKQGEFPHFRQIPGPISSTGSIRPQVDLDGEFEMIYDRDDCFPSPMKRRRTSQDIINQIFSLDLSGSENELEQDTVHPLVLGEKTNLKESQKECSEKEQKHTVSPTSSQCAEEVANITTKCGFYKVTSPGEVTDEGNINVTGTYFCKHRYNFSDMCNDTYTGSFQLSGGHSPLQPRILLYQGRVFWSQEIAQIWKKDCRKWLWKNSSHKREKRAFVK